MASQVGTKNLGNVLSTKGAGGDQSAPEIHVFMYMSKGNHYAPSLTKVKQLYTFVLFYIINNRGEGGSEERGIGASKKLFMQGYMEEEGPMQSGFF